MCCNTHHVEIDLMHLHILCQRLREVYIDLKVLIASYCHTARNHNKTQRDIDIVLYSKVLLSHIRGITNKTGAVRTTTYPEL